MSKRRLMMLGPPGAGKGTQAKRIASEMSIPHISTGDMLREARRKGTEMGKEAVRYMDAGQLVPDEVVIGIVRDRLDEDDASRGFVLDGFPRTRAQAEALLQMGIELDAVLNVVVNDETVIGRLGGRISCPSCGAVYHEKFNPPASSDVCDACGHQGLIKRDDDQPEAIKSRLEGYHAQTAPLIAFYQEIGVLVAIDGEQSPEDVHDAIAEVIG
ncbi:adenylate kinase [Lujinxingia sediminis]|uniref:Adenylate kinase n=1 Tax=Lujinxingia sediminis TaxID=2480984 RepID=A0ABY0CQD3_9DELT|nr:adenylate kinase [Lujinxingia sediminis]RVU42270.1 adenylate kinase [Lujinxingia sediminis]